MLQGGGGGGGDGDEGGGGDAGGDAFGTAGGWVDIYLCVCAHAFVVLCTSCV